VELARTENMHVCCRFGVGDKVCNGNTLRIRFNSPVEYARRMHATTGGIAHAFPHLPPNGTCVATGTESTRSSACLRLHTVADCALVKSLPASGWLHAGPSPDSRYLAGDEKNPPGQGMLWLLDLESGAESPLCVHGSSYRIFGKNLPNAHVTQDAHPHPSFSPDGKHVLFTSDKETGREGNCAVYAVEVSV